MDDHQNVNMNSEKKKKKKKVKRVERKKKKGNNNAFDGSEEVPGVIMFGATGPGGMAVRNPIILKNIVDYLEDLDLCHLYWSCKIFENIIDQMDKSCWQKRAQKIAKGIDSRLIQNVESLMEKWQHNSFRQICIIIMTEKVRSLFNQEILGPASILFGPEDEDFKVAASFAHHGLLGPVLEMSLSLSGGCLNRDLHLIPADHIGSLAACVTGTVNIEERHPETDHLLTILDNLKCALLEISYRSLDTGETWALLRAMMKGVKRVELGTNTSLNFDVLTQYDGEDACERFEWLDMEEDYRECIRTWAENMNWNIVEEEPFYSPDHMQKIVIERKKKA